MRGQPGVPGWSEHRRVAVDPYWLVIQQDSSVGANALADGGVDGRRSKWSVQKWPSRRTAARPIAAAADDATRRRPPQDVCRPRCRRTWWSGGCGPRDALGKSPLLEQNFACFRLRFRQDLGRRSEDRRRQSVFEPRVVWQSAETEKPNTAALEGAGGVRSWRREIGAGACWTWRGGDGWYESRRTSFVWCRNARGARGAVSAGTRPRRGKS